jgi:hypothetical protein
MGFQSETHARGPGSGDAMISPERPVPIDVITYAPAAFFHCLHCELVWQESAVRAQDRAEQLTSSLPDDLRDQYQQLSDWVHRMLAARGPRLKFRILDAVSIQGVLTALRYGVRRFPAVIVDGQERSVGAHFERATMLIERRLAAHTRGSA